MLPPVDGSAEPLSLGQAARLWRAVGAFREVCPWFLMGKATYREQVPIGDQADD